MSEGEDTLNRIKTHKTVLWYLIVNNEGGIVRGAFKDEEENKNIANSVPLLTAKARSVVRDLDSTNDLIFLCIQTRLNEIMVAPNEEFSLIVIQTKGEKHDENEWINEWKGWMFVFSFLQEMRKKKRKEINYFFWWIEDFVLEM